MKVGVVGDIFGTERRRSIFGRLLAICVLSQPTLAHYAATAQLELTVLKGGGRGEKPLNVFFRKNDPILRLLMICWPQTDLTGPTFHTLPSSML